MTLEQTGIQSAPLVTEAELEQLKNNIEQRKNNSDKDLSESYIKLLSAYISMNKIKDANNLSTEAEEKAPDILEKSEYWYYRAKMEASRNNPQKTLESLEKSVNLHKPGNALSDDVYFDSLLSICEIYASLGDKENTLKWLDRARVEAEQSFNYFDYKKDMADLYEMAGEFATTIEIYEKIIETENLSNEDKKLLIVDLSNIYMKYNQVDKVISLQSKISDPEEVKSNWYQVVSYLEDKKDFATAEEVYSEIIKILPDESRAYLGRAVARLIQDKESDAMADIAEARECAVSEDDMLKVGLIYLQLEQAEQAKSCFEDMLKIDDNNYNANLYMASLEQTEGKTEEAQSRLEKIIGLYPGEADGYIQLGNLFLINKNIDKAFEIFEKVKTIDEFNSYVYYALAVCNVEKNNDAAAIEHLKHALDLEPGNQTVTNLYMSIKAKTLKSDN